jgi:hypothetical protein
MITLNDKNVQALYITVRNDSEPMINEMQRGAVEMLLGMARDGNTEAAAALGDLATAPNLHPLLREIILEKTRALVNA